MYITDATHFLDAKGAIGPKRGPARKLAEFLGNAIVAATMPRLADSQPTCMKCGNRIEASIGALDEVLWRCVACPEAGRISNWRNTLWDMSATNCARHS